ncbi:nSTAND1 domain-containing NTPase [Streptomyces sp. NBC_01483]|uniref:nSTAND1 domain-containing NTPase n=1 Tax=Streptomyces sp. NBC_01483 TaxID=2903883 RepID=UPI002E30D567|nr:helix-turn-helix domain-containing protein [Streptomyces sp. NBC_01483]
MQRFAFELRKLRAEAGGITYRVLAQRAGYSITTLSQAAGGEQLPTLPVVLAYSAACGGDPVEWEARWKQAVDEVAAMRPADDGEDAEPPYKGLARFETGDHDHFFGRDRLTTDLLDLLRRRRFTAVFGPSGSGKSSLLRAGLIPTLQRTQDANLRPAAIRILTPGDRPAHTHARLLDPSNSGVDGARVDTFLIVDQFEETFTLCQDPTERARFIHLLLAARRPESRLRVLIAVRADFYGHCAEQHDLSDALRDAHLLAGPMSPAELREAIVKPAAAAGLTVERALTSRLVDEVTDAPGGLPLLSHVLLETWRRRRGKTLTMAGYEAAGGLGAAVAKTAEHVYNRFTEGQARAARRMLLRLVTPGDGTPDTRRPTERAELQATGGQETAQVLEALTAARLLTLDGDTVDLAHEALLTAWPRLRGWIEQDRERLRAHRKLTEAARAWADLGRDLGALYRGTRLATTHEEFGPERSADLTELERDFLTASTISYEQEEHAAARTAHRLRTLTASLSVLLVLAVTASLIAWNQSGLSDQQRQNADAARKVALSRQLAAQSTALIGTDSDLASLLAIHAYQTSPTSQAVESLYVAAGAPLRHRLTRYATSVVSMAFSPDSRTLTTVGLHGSVGLWDVRSGRLRRGLPEGNDPVAAVFSPDGRTLAMGSSTDQGIQLWDVTSGRVRRGLAERTADTVPLAFSPDGRTLAMSSLDHGVDLWNTATGHLPRSLPLHAAQLVSLAFSPDGQTLATGSVDGGVTLWNTDTGRLRRSFPQQATGAVDAMAFSPDGDTLATGIGGHGVELWNTATGRLRRGLLGDTSQVGSLAFSPNGRTLATAGQDRSVRLWDVGSGRLHRSLAGHTATVISLAFSADGRSLATGGKDGTVRLWDVAADQSQKVLSGHLEQADAMAFSPDGRTLATRAVADQGVRLWDAATGHVRGRLARHSGDIDSLAFGPDGRTLATGGIDHGVELWNTTTGHIQGTLPGFTDTVGSLAFSPDGRTLATGSTARGVELWNTTTGHIRRRFPGFNGDVNAMAFSPDGHTLAIGGSDRTVRLWDIVSGRLLKSLAGHTAPVDSVAFSPDGRTLATGGDDHAVRLWDATSGHIRASLTGYTGEAGSLAFSPDGRILAAGGDDHTLRLWETTTGGTLATLSGHTNTVLAVAFSPDGHTLTTASPDQSIRVWDATPSPAAAIRKICRAIGRDLTPQEHSVYLPNQPPHTICTT